TTEDLERINLDNIYPSSDQLQSFLKQIYYIPQKSNKEITNWDDLNNDRYVNLVNQYDTLPEYAQQLIDTIDYIDNLQAKNKRLNQLKKELQTDLFTYYISTY